MDGSLFRPEPERTRIAVIGTGIAGLSAAWLLSKAHDVTLFEKDGRIGGHSNTIDVTEGEKTVPVDTGFIVYNEPNYPNLVALFDHLGVQTKLSDMSFAVSTDGGAFEYAGNPLGLFARRRNLVSPRFWAMIRDIHRFYRDAPVVLTNPNCADLTLGDYLDAEGYSEPFMNDHILPMGAAIWSSPVETMRGYPLRAFLSFYDNHGLLKLRSRPRWRTVVGGSRSYVRKLISGFRGTLAVGCGVKSVRRLQSGAIVVDQKGRSHVFDHVVIATHADQALAMLEDPDPAERRVLGVFGYSANHAVVHGDPALMPRRRRAWSSWNYLRENSVANAPVTVTYWMNRLQGFRTHRPVLVSLNPLREPNPSTVVASFSYEHPVFDQNTLAAQSAIWDLQGGRNTWFCGSYLGAGFHEDALQSGLVVAERLGRIRRPWQVVGGSGRLRIPDEISAINRLMGLAA